jgi:hypothetical protein
MDPNPDSVAPVERGIAGYSITDRATANAILERIRQDRPGRVAGTVVLGATAMGDDGVEDIILLQFLFPEVECDECAEGSHAPTFSVVLGTDLAEVIAGRITSVLSSRAAWGGIQDG